MMTSHTHNAKLTVFLLALATSFLSERWTPDVPKYSDREVDMRLGVAGALGVGLGLAPPFLLVSGGGIEEGRGLLVLASLCLFSFGWWRGFFSEEKVSSESEGDEIIIIINNRYTNILCL